jgi:anti-sigma factor RsiW
LLSDYVDRELTDAERTAVERHLDSCGKCGTESSRIHGLKKIMQHWRGVSGSGEFRKVLVEKMIRESQQMQAPAGTGGPAAEGTAPQAAVQQRADDRTLPPIWILLAAAVVAVAAYCLVRWLRGL